jgi:hypothetical protein
MYRRAILPLAGSILAIALAACSGSVGADTATTVATAEPVATDSTATSTVATVSANTASQSEIAAALQAAGVPNADRWAAEVVEYRPYPADDATLQKLQDNLAKYQPDGATLVAILSTLRP